MLAFTEPFDVIEAIDKEQSAVIKLITSYSDPEKHINEIKQQSGISYQKIHRLLRKKATHHTKVEPDKIIKLVEQGKDASTITIITGYLYQMVTSTLHNADYFYNKRLNRWVKRNSVTSTTPTVGV